MGMFDTEDDIAAKQMPEFKLEKLNRVGAHAQEYHRAKIPGGWLVDLSWGHNYGLTFVPDPNHEWQ